LACPASPIHHQHDPVHQDQRARRDHPGSSHVANLHARGLAPGPRPGSQF
jgi:hypothetical protein